MTSSQNPWRKGGNAHCNILLEYCVADLLHSNTQLGGSYTKAKDATLFQPWKMES